MARKTKLDAPGGPRKSSVILLILAALLFSQATQAQERASDAERLAAAKSAFDAGRWEEAAALAQGPENQSPDLDFVEGLALARLEKWSGAKSAFTVGVKKAPNDSRFLMELAGVAYKEKDYKAAKRNLHAALRLQPQDSYSYEFLGTLYFLEGNLEAALKYWNLEGKPRLRSVTFVPSLRLRESLQERALAFNAPQVLTGGALRTTEARLANLDVFSSERIAMSPAESGSYDAILHVTERNGWGDSTTEGVVSLLSGLPYATVYPEFYNFGGRAINLTALGRWDSEKRRASGTLSLPMQGNPGLRLRVFADARNENWNLSQTFLGVGTTLSDINVRRFVAGAQIDSVVNGTWSWIAGAEVSNRNFRNVPAGLTATQREFFTSGSSLSGRLGVRASFVRVPEHRFILHSSAEGMAGREFAQGLGPFVTVRGSLHANWLPRATDDDFEMNATIRGGATAGKDTLDELFQLGVERDNDLWMRGHAGTLGGRKGAAPLGRRYFLSNWEMDKNIYRNGFFTMKVGPFLDNGAIADSFSAIGSREWLWDSGLQCKVRILGGITAVFSYGRNLHGGKGVFYGAVIQEPQSPH